MIFPSSARFFLRSSQPSAYAFSSFQALRHYQLPRPEAIRWQKELANTVHVIGIIGKPVQFRYTQTEKAFAWTRLGAKLTANSSETTWFSLKFWEEMAEIAAEHLKTGDRVYVSGHMDLKEVGNDNIPTENKIVVSMLNFVERDSSSLPQIDVNMNSSSSGSEQEGINMKCANSGSGSGSQQEGTNMKHANSGNMVLETEKLWLAFFSNPTEWWDNRKDKKNPRAPDFKHKSSGEVLWIGSYSSPSWVKSKLDKLDESMMFSHELSKTKKSSLFDDKDFDLF